MVGPCAGWASFDPLRRSKVRDTKEKKTPSATSNERSSQRRKIKTNLCTLHQNSLWFRLDFEHSPGSTYKPISWSTTNLTSSPKIIFINIIIYKVRTLFLYGEQIKANERREGKFIFLENYADYSYICCLPSPFLGYTCAGEDTSHLFLLAKVPSSFFVREEGLYICRHNWGAALPYGSSWMRKSHVC